VRTAGNVDSTEDIVTTDVEHGGSVAADDYKCSNQNEFTIYRWFCVWKLRRGC